LTSSLEVDSKRVTRTGVVLLARTNPQPFLKLIRTPSTSIMSLMCGKFAGGFLSNFLTLSIIFQFEKELEFQSKYKVPTAKT